MSFITRCPGCATAFRVKPVQLTARAGRVRCGMCGEVFDGIAGLVEPGNEIRRPEPTPPPAAPPEPAHPPTLGASSGAAEPLPAFMTQGTPQPRGLWWTLTALAAIVLVGQATYHFRSEIAVNLPATRGALDLTCRWLGCEVSLPRQLRLLSIDSYEVRADPRREGIIVLTAVIRNRAPFPQEYPALQFALTDDASRYLVSRVLSPRDYLEAGNASHLISKGIDANGEASLTVHFDTSRTRASGYRLELFYPS